jgi:hypothetical protein
MVELLDPCDIAIGENVWVWKDSGDTWRLQPLENANACGVFVYARMDDAPCATNDAGQCDVAGDPPIPAGF